MKVLPLASGPVSSWSLIVGIARRGEQGREPVEPADDLVGDLTGRDVARPANHCGHTEGALPVRVLLATERRHRPIRPCVHVRAVVGRVDHDRVVGDPEIVELLEQRPDCSVVLDHAVRIFGAGSEARLVAMLWPHMGAQMHAGCVHPDEEGLSRLDLPVHEVHRRG